MSKKPRPEKKKVLVIEAAEPKRLEMVDGRYPINKEITRVDLAFPARSTHLMPAYTGDYRCSWADKIASKWFYGGLKDEDIPKVKDGIDLTAALTHLSVVLRSFQHKHEHKMEAAARLIENWFEEPEKEKTNATG